MIGGMSEGDGLQSAEWLQKITTSGRDKTMRGESISVLPALSLFSCFVIRTPAWNDFRPVLKIRFRS